ncbi:hypothetical protein BDR26DRAFT_934317 [Obelidium mucronatum]|nr:hypothetical protein BDR26DRAFT_934317 [Obelidium mucronatum]
MQFSRFFIFACIAVSSVFGQTSSTVATASAAANASSPVEQANKFITGMLSTVPLCLITCLTNATSITPALVTSLCGLAADPSKGLALLSSAPACITSTCGTSAEAATGALTNITTALPQLAQACSTLAAASAAPSSSVVKSSTTAAAASSTLSATTKTGAAGALEAVASLGFASMLMVAFLL